jgi:hypothetical protein
MPITPAEMVDIGNDAFRMAQFILHALKEDERGLKKLDKEEMKELLKQHLLPLAAKVARDLVD